MKAILKGGMWDGTECDVTPIPPLYVTLGTPSVVYRYARVLVEKGDNVVVYEAYELPHIDNLIEKICVVDRTRGIIAP